MTVKSKYIGEILGMKVDTVNSCIKKLANLGIIDSRIVSDKEEGGKIRFITWNELIEYRLPTNIKEKKEVTGKNLVKGGNLEKPSSLYNNIIHNNNTNKDNINNISDVIYSNKRTGKKTVTLDKPDKNISKIKMSSVSKQEDNNIAIKTKRKLTEEESSLFSIYNSLIKGNFNKNSLSVFEGVPRCLKLFKEIYNNKASEKFKEAINLLLSSSKWKWLINKDPTISQPKRFFNQTFMENNLITQLDIKVKQVQENKFADDKDVKLANKHSQEALEKLMINS